MWQIITIFQVMQFFILLVMAKTGDYLLSIKLWLIINENLSYLVGSG